MWTSNSQLMNRVLSAELCWLSLSDTFQGFSTDGKNANLLQKFQSFLLTVPTVWFSCYTIYLFEPSRAYIFPFAPMQPRAVEPGLKQDWNLKLNLERQTTDWQECPFLNRHLPEELFTAWCSLTSNVVCCQSAMIGVRESRLRVARVHTFS
jgi:hypothetical protein